MRNVDFYQTESGFNPAEEFLDKLPVKVVKKIFWVFKLVEDLETVPAEYLKKLVSTDDIWEIRVQHGNNAYRFLGFFDGSDLIILNSAFVKKSQKTPKKEIKKAEERKKEYFRRKK